MLPSGGAGAYRPPHKFIPPWPQSGCGPGGRRRWRRRGTRRWRRCWSGPPPCWAPPASGAPVLNRGCHCYSHARRLGRLRSLALDGAMRCREVPIPIKLLILACPAPCAQHGGQRGRRRPLQPRAAQAAGGAPPRGAAAEPGQCGGGAGAAWAGQSAGGTAAAPPRRGRRRRRQWLGPLAASSRHMELGLCLHLEFIANTGGS